jgi:hypothetical protein
MIGNALAPIPAGGQVTFIIRTSCTANQNIVRAGSALVGRQQNKTMDNDDAPVAAPDRREVLALMAAPARCRRLSSDARLIYADECCIMTATTAPEAAAVAPTSLPACVVRELTRPVLRRRS